MTSRVQTVLGAIKPSELGVTLTHEHLSMNFEHFYRKPPETLVDFFQTKPTLENVGYIRQYPYSSRHNLILDDEEANIAVLDDVKAYKKFGGGAIVENTTKGLDRDIKFYEEVAQSCGVHVIAGTGHYIEDVQPDNYLHYSTEDIYNRMMGELTEGFPEEPQIKAGFMGEIASVWPIREFERRAIRAAGELQPQVGCGVSFHPHRNPEAPFEIIRLYCEAGGSADKVVMSHLDRKHDFTHIRSLHVQEKLSKKKHYIFSKKKKQFVLFNFVSFNYLCVAVDHYLFFLRKLLISSDYYAASAIF
ncbi:phosphotriesterase-related protein isoform X2 [Trichoplusia ni]|uniref:Phosphotriesterase-related protein n=1 Tax=Trichoplusia ni TaxID=7111 RepID=A0A7E5VZF7_TRINI|nr:phosphotriesterase-related protein isoform X2 [Trichoplusia ni]